MTAYKNVLDMTYRILRKSLSPKVYVLLQKVFGRRKYYYSPFLYMQIVNRYLKAGPIDCKVILEVGPGNDITTAILMILEGAREVFLADEVNELTTHRREFPNRLQYIESISQSYKESCEGKLSITEISSRIHMIPHHVSCEFLYQLNIPKVDCLFSNHVLEHVEDLDDVFSAFKTLVKPGGIMFHSVDLSDHAYHVFTRYPRLRILNENNVLSHLKYSDGTFKMLNDKKLPMNRVLLPQYIDLCTSHGFAIRDIWYCQPKKHYHVHPDILGKTKQEFHDSFMSQINYFEISAKREEDVASSQMGWNLTKLGDC
ncbi:MAG: methyltransferase domain-containing protein [Candidatus Abyssobacteria bacterium SURF_5]|uniref:Methyltransferase domain-containing protein n=1 Tax=Abyssobacteria bacterium (strain SURF_5) TaxID=2093360 RepID=A0A3A4P2T0_ABYX5|nr:MAG: methyltransferase domain-containing protein [Candidatus Abyssubacteria bacterium SURF_5]